MIEEDIVSTCRMPLYSGEEGGGVVLNHWSIQFGKYIVTCLVYG